MKKILLFCAGLLLMLQAKAQFNQGFEMINADGTPSFWRPPLQMIVFPLDTSCSWVDTAFVRYLTHDAHTGSYALGLGVAGYCDSRIGGSIRAARYNADTGFVDQRQPFTSRPAAFTFYYKLQPVQGDRVITEILLEDTNSNTVASATFTLSQAANGWAQATVPLTYYSNDRPGLLSMSFKLRSDSVLHLGTRFIIDDINHNGATGIGSINPASLIQVSCYPAPAKDFVLIDTRNMNTVATTVNITDAAGRLIREAKAIPAGNGRLRLEVEDLLQGIYFVTFLNGNNIAAGRFIK